VESLHTAARNAGKIDMSLSESEIRSLQCCDNLITTARRGGNINMDQSETEVRRQAMAQVRGRSVDNWRNETLQNQRPPLPRPRLTSILT